MRNVDRTLTRSLLFFIFFLCLRKLLKSNKADFFSKNFAGETHVRNGFLICDIFNLRFFSNTDHETHVTNELPSPITSRYFRLIVQTEHSQAMVRLEYQTCQNLPNNSSIMYQAAFFRNLCFQFSCSNNCFVKIKQKKKSCISLQNFKLE